MEPTDRCTRCNGGVGDFMCQGCRVAELEAENKKHEASMRHAIGKLCDASGRWRSDEIAIANACNELRSRLAPWRIDAARGDDDAD